MLPLWHDRRPGASARAEGLDLGVERIAVDRTAQCCKTLYVRDLAEALSDLENAAAKRLKNSRYQTLLFQGAL